MQLFENTKIIHKYALTKYICYMKKFILLPLIFILTICAFSGCAKGINYSDYISERRSAIYLYEDDDTSIKIYCSQKEQPYAADGIKSELNDIIEVFVTLPKNPQVLSLSVEGHSGEMNYQAVDNCYYLSFSGKAFSSESVAVTLVKDGESKEYSALTVIYAGVISCDDAVKCVSEYDKELFESLTSNNLFDGEIYVRLLYDDGCYYYVGVCDKQNNVSAYLLDGERGKVIATKKINGK